MNTLHTKTTGFFIFWISFSFAHFGHLPNHLIQPYDKLILSVSYDSFAGLFRVSGHAHYPDGTLLIISLQNICDSSLKEVRRIYVISEAFSCNFGPYVSKLKTPFLGRYKITVWFVHNTQTSSMQGLLNSIDLYCCNPPCSIDYQNCKEEIVLIGNQADAKKEFQETLQIYETWLEDTQKLEEDYYSYFSEFEKNTSLDCRDLKNEGITIKEKIILIQTQIVELKRKKNLILYEETLNKLTTFLNSLEKEIQLLENTSITKEENEKLRKFLENKKSLKEIEMIRQQMHESIIKEK